MTQPNIHHAADYADALVTAKRAKNSVFLILLFALLLELALFFVARYTSLLDLAADSKITARRGVVQWLIGVIDFLGLILPGLLAIMLLLILNVMLVGRLLGTGRLTASFVSCAVLALLLFPWQSFLNNPTINGDPTANALGLKFPGALYTWAELTHKVPDDPGRSLGATFSTVNRDLAFLRWTRFVAYPLFCLILLLLIQIKSDRGLRQALGSDVAVSTDPSA